METIKIGSLSLNPSDFMPTNTEAPNQAVTKDELRIERLLNLLELILDTHHDVLSQFIYEELLGALRRHGKRI